MIKRFALAATTVALVAAGSAATAMAAQPSAARQHRASAQQTRHRRAPTRPDPVVAFNQLLQQVVMAPGAQPATIHPTRTMAITQIAVYDAVNGILGQGRPMLVAERGPRHASADAAAAAAARTALDALLPRQRVAVDGFYANTLAQMGSSVASGPASGSASGWPARCSPSGHTTVRRSRPRCSRRRRGRVNTSSRRRPSAGRLHSDRARDAVRAALPAPVPAGAAARAVQPPVRR